MSPFSLSLLLVVSGLIGFCHGQGAEETVEEIPEYSVGIVSSSISTRSEPEDEAIEEESVEDETVKEEALNKDLQLIVLENRSLRKFLTTSVTEYEAFQASLPNKLMGCNFWKTVGCATAIAAASAFCVASGIPDGEITFIPCEVEFLGAASPCVSCLTSVLPPTDLSTDIPTIEAGQVPEIVSGNKMMKAVLSTAHAYKVASTLVSGSAQLCSASADHTCPVSKWLICAPVHAVAYAGCLHNPVIGITFDECVRLAVGSIDESCLPCCTPAISFMQHL